MPEDVAQSLAEENAQLRARLEEAEDLLRAIRNGELDALVVDGGLYRLESAEAASNRLRGEILEEIADAVIAVDHDRHITFLNAAAARLYEVNAAEMLGRDLRDLFRERRSPPGGESANAKSSGERNGWRGETTHITPRGKEISVESSISVLHDHNRAVVGHLEIVRDISSRKAAEAALQESHAQFAEISRAFRGITENSPDLITRFDRQHRHVYVNPAVTAATGLSSEQFLGRTHREMGFAEHHCASWEQAQDQVFESGAKVSLEFSYDPVKGDRRWYHALLVPEFGPDKHVEFVLTIVRDITELRKSTDTLRHSEERFRVLAETLPDIIFTAEPDGARDYHNPPFYELTGLFNGKSHGWGWLDAVHPDDVARVRAKWASATTSGEQYRDEYRYQARDGKFRWFSSRAQAMRDGQGRVTKWLGICSDINDHKEGAEVLERTVAERTAKLQETVSELETFSYSISHDLRAPLRAMHSYAAFLRAEYEDSIADQGKEYIRRIVAAADRMDRLIQDVLVYSRVARSELHLELVPLETFLPGMMESYPQFSASNARIDLVRPLATVQANQAALTQCVSNLIGNAIKFVPAPKTPHIRVWTEVDGARVKLFVRDNGIGINTGDQDRIFDIFQKLDPGSSGTGIGLAVVRKAAERMGGSVEVKSAPGKGSTFCLSLQGPDGGIDPAK